MNIEGVDATEASERIVELERHVANLKQAVDSRQRIGVSVGLLAHQLNCDPDEAWKSLARLSQNTNTRAGTIARVLVDLHCHRVSAADAELADTLRDLLSPRRRVRTVGADLPAATGAAGEMSDGQPRSAVVLPLHPPPATPEADVAATG